MTKVRIRIKRVGGTCSATSLIVNADSVTRGLILIFNRYDLVMLFIIQPFKFLLYYFVFCIFHSTRMNLRSMILRGWAGSICLLQNVKSYMSYLQQYTHIIKMLTLKTYFSWIWSKLKRTRSQITSYIYVSNWKSSYDSNDVMLVMCQNRQWHFADFFFNL